MTRCVGLAHAADLDWETLRDWDERQIVARLLAHRHATIADAILDRLLQRVHRFTLEGESRRTGASARRNAGTPRLQA